MATGWEIGEPSSNCPWPRERSEFIYAPWLSVQIIRVISEKNADAIFTKKKKTVIITMQKYVPCPQKGLRNRRKINKKTNYYYVRYKEYRLFFISNMGSSNFTGNIQNIFRRLNHEIFVRFLSTIFNRYNQYVWYRYSIWVDG